MNTTRIALALTLALASLGVTAQGADAEKKALVAKIMKLQQAQIEQFGLNMLQQPVQQMLRNAEQVMMARVPEDKREATAKAMMAEAQSFVRDVSPALKAAATKNAQATYGATLEAKFSAAELKELIQVMESATMKRYVALTPELNQALAQRVSADTKAAVEPRLRALDQKLVQILGITPSAAAAPASAPKQP